MEVFGWFSLVVLALIGVGTIVAFVAPNVVEKIKVIVYQAKKFAEVAKEHINANAEIRRAKNEEKRKAKVEKLKNKKAKEDKKEEKPIAEEVKEEPKQEEKVEVKPEQPVEQPKENEEVQPEVQPQEEEKTEQPTTYLESLKANTASSVDVQ